MWAKSLLLSALIVGSPFSGRALDTAQPGLSQNMFVLAQHRRGGDDGGNRGDGGGRQQDVRPLREVVDELRREYGGELINARSDGPYYMIRWRMPNGEVRDFRVSAVR